MAFVTSVRSHAPSYPLKLLGGTTRQIELRWRLSNSRNRDGKVGQISASVAFSCSIHHLSSFYAHSQRVKSLKSLRPSETLMLVAICRHAFNVSPGLLSSFSFERYTSFFVCASHPFSLYGSLNFILPISPLIFQKVTPIFHVRLEDILDWKHLLPLGPSLFFPVIHPCRFEGFQGTAALC